MIEVTNSGVDVSVMNNVASNHSLYSIALHNLKIKKSGR